MEEHSREYGDSSAHGKRNWAISSIEPIAKEKPDGEG